MSDVKKTEENKRIGTGKAGPGRPKGATNRVTGEVKAMIVAALNAAGGAEYLQKQAKENPNAFLSLVGRIVPTEVHGPGEEGEHALTVTLKW